MDVVRQDISRYAAIKLLIPLKSDTPRVYWRSVKRLDWVSRPNSKLPEIKGGLRGCGVQCAFTVTKVLAAGFNGARL